jgi:CBS domain-containing protein
LRRAPVVDKGGLLSGLLSIDDVLVELSSELSDIICLIFQEQITEVRTR